MALELKTFVVNLKSLDQEISDPIVAGAGDADGRTFKLIFTQEAAAQLTPETKVYLKWHHKQLNIDGYNVFTQTSTNPVVWEIKWPLTMLYEGDVKCVFELVDNLSIAQSTGFIVHVLEDPHTGASYVATDDFTEFQQACIELATVKDEMIQQMLEQKIEFEDMKLIFQEVRKDSKDAVDIAEHALSKAKEALEEVHETSVPARILDPQKGQILIYDADRKRWVNRKFTDNNSIVYLEEGTKGLSLKNYDTASDGQMLVKDNLRGLRWVDPKDPSGGRAYDDLEEIKDYLFETTYSNLDYQYALDYFKNLKPQDFKSIGACSAIRKGNWYGRNFDWEYDDKAEFIVHTPNTNGYYATIGVSNGIDKLTNDFVKSRENTELYKIVPFFIKDGINEKGLICSDNVVPTDKGINKKSIPQEEEEIELCSYMLVRYVLDHFATAREAVNYVRDHVSIYPPKDMLNLNYEIHFMVADATDTFIIEVLDNRNVVFKVDEDGSTRLAGKPYMTNFYLAGVHFDEDNKVIINRDNSNLNTSHVSLHGNGLERYNLIVDNYEEIENASDMRRLLNKLKYTNAYDITQEPFWYTEYAGMKVDSRLEDSEILKVTSTENKYTKVLMEAQEFFENRSRDPQSPYFGTSQTVHSSLYEIDTRKLNIIVQEDGEELQFKFPDHYCTLEEVKELADEESITFDRSVDKFRIEGFKSAEVGTSPIKDSDSSISWKKMMDKEEVIEIFDGKLPLNINDPVEGEVLKYNSELGKWENAHEEIILPIIHEDIIVDLGVGGHSGTYRTGDVIEAGTLLEEVIRKMLIDEFVPPTPTVLYNVYYNIFEDDSSEIDADYIKNYGLKTDITNIETPADAPHLEIYAEDADNPKGIFIAIPTEKSNFRLKVVTPINGSFVITSEFIKQSSKISIDDMEYNWWIFEPAKLEGNEEYEISFR